VDRVRIELVLVTQTEVQSESRCNAPVVLDEVVKAGGLHCQTENTEALVEVSCVALTCATSGADAETRIRGWSIRRAWNLRATRTARREVGVVDDEVRKP